MEKLENDILTARLRKVQTELKELGIYDERNIQSAQETSFAFVVYTLQRFLGNYNIEEIIDNVTEGGQDNSIDILHIDNNSENEININVFQCKYKTEANLTSTIGENDVDLFLRKVKTIIIDKDISNISTNPNLEQQLNMLWDISQNTELNNIHLNLFLVTNGANINEQEKNTLKKFQEENSIVKKIDILCDYDFMIGKQDTPIDKIVIPIDKNYIQLNNGINTCIVSFSAFDIACLYEKTGDVILEKNVRKLIKSKINQNIYNSLIDDPGMFWYKNNGLSIVCERFEVKTMSGRKELEITHPYIVNGGQTTKTIYNHYLRCANDEEKLTPLYDASVIARIYQTTAPEQITEIVQGTNTQNKITMYDLKSTNSNLRKIKEFFYENHISLLINRDIEEEKLALSINSDTLLQLYCSLYIGIPHKAKISISKLIEDYYDDVYNTPDIHTKLLNTFKINQVIKNKNKEHTDIIHLKHSSLSLLFVIGLLNPTLKDVYDEELLMETYDNALNILNEIVEKQKTEDVNYSNHNFFKSEKSTIQIKNKLQELSEIEENNA